MGRKGSGTGDYLGHRFGVVREDDIDTIRSQGIAPSGYHIRLAYIEDPVVTPIKFLMSSPHMELLDNTSNADSNEPNSFAVTMALGHVGISVHGGPGVTPPSRWIDGSSAHPLMLWPPTRGGIRRPPKHPVIRS